MTNDRCSSIKHYVRFKVLRAVATAVNCFLGYGGSMFLENISICLQSQIASYPRRQKSPINTPII
jgi:hypothetical protein